MRVSHWLATLVALVLTFAGVTGVSVPAHANGCITPAAGTAADPFLIQNASNLECLYGNDAYYWAHSPAYHFRVTNNIDMVGAVWTHGIGDSVTSFNGVFDGAGHTITGLDITQGLVGTSGLSSVGFFGATGSGSEIKNLKLTNIDVVATNTLGFISKVGLLVGSNAATVSDVSASGTVTATTADVVTMLGGLVGFSSSSTISRVVADVQTRITASTPGRLGGLIGLANSTTLSNCASYGSFTATEGGNGTTTIFGGLVGRLQNSSVTDCLTMTGISTNHIGHSSGSFIGSAATSTIDDSFWDDSVSPDFTNAIGATTSSTVTNLNAKGTADLQHYVTYVAPANVATPWNMGNTYETTPTHIWGLCYGAVAPFLQALTYTSPCLPEPTVTLPVTTVAAGQSLTVSGVNFMPNTRIRITLYSTPVILSTVSADGSGAFSTTVTIPADTAVGTHTLEVFDEIEWTKINTSITVNAQLAQTAAPKTTDALLAISLLLAGAVLALYARRRQNV